MIEETQQNSAERKSIIGIIAAISKEKRALGKGNQLLWHIPEDLKRFKEITSGHPVIMGRKTWESLPSKFRPLAGRTNIVITRNKEYGATGANVVDSIEGALAAARLPAPDRALRAGGQTGKASGGEEIFIIGGAEIYKLALPFTDRLYLTIVDEEKEADVFFPDYSQFKKEISRECNTENDPAFCFVVLEK